MNTENVIYFYSFGDKNIPKERNLKERKKKFIGNENIIKNIYRIEAYNSVKCEYFCVGFIDFMEEVWTFPFHKTFFS